MCLSNLACYVCCPAIKLPDEVVRKSGTLQKKSGKGVLGIAGEFIRALIDVCSIYASSFAFVSVLCDTAYTCAVGTSAGAEIWQARYIVLTDTKASLSVELSSLPQH